MRRIRHVIWDFNGTLLDDVDCSIDTLNTLLAERNLSPITRQRYLARFRFPVREFYLELGFDFEREDFDRVAHTFIARYTASLQAAAPHAEAQTAVRELSRRAVGQSVLSAMEHTLLRSLIERFGLGAAMTHVKGLADHRAHSKVELGRELARELRLRPDELLLVGDTLHDYETALAIGCDCLIFTRGHQDAARLAHSPALQIASLTEVASFVDRQRRA